MELRGESLETQEISCCNPVRRKDGDKSSCGTLAKRTELRVGLELKLTGLDGRLEEEQDLV